MKIKYEERSFKPDTLAVIEQAEVICDEYARQGYELTLRQLYYQFVARGYIPNTDQSYKRLGSIVDGGRLAGLIDWNHIVDRTRNLRGTSHWDSPSDIIQASAESFRLDKWTDQDTRIEVWVEKEALAGVIQRAANAWDVNWFSCRGYVSQSEMWSAGRRHRRYRQRGQRVLVLHLGDHDPSGIDMSRDIEERLRTFGEFDGARYDELEVRRIALNMDQVRQYDPPPNPRPPTRASPATSTDTVTSPGSWTPSTPAPWPGSSTLRSGARSTTSGTRSARTRSAGTARCWTRRRTDGKTSCGTWRRTKMPDLRIHDRSQLVALARRLGVRDDWHEPDNQGVSARVYGTHLDNAMPAGTWMGTDGLGAPHAELYVVLTRDREDEPERPTPEAEPVALINLATLLAWACGYDERGTRCTCATVSANGDPEAGDTELDINCPEHGTEAGYAVLGRRYEALMDRLRHALAPSADPAEAFSLFSYDRLEAGAVRAVELAVEIARGHQ